jgi:hypothetical protein
MATTSLLNNSSYAGSSLICDDLDGCLTYDNSGYVTAGDCIITTTDTTADNYTITVPNSYDSGTIRCFSGTSSIATVSSSSTWITTDKRIIYGKEGDVMMDIQNMKFKVYCEERGWIEYDIEDFITKSLEGKKKIVLEGSRETSVSEMITERNKRKVLVEKMPKQKESYLITSGFINTDGVTGTWTILGNGYNNYQPTVYYGGTAGTAIGTTAIGTTAIGAITTGTNNTAIGYCTLTNTTPQITANGNTAINGNLTVNGDINVDGDLIVNGTLTYTNINKKA